MIKVLFQENQDYKTIALEGHADFNKHGKDIVCASISTAIIITVNLIEKLQLNEHIVNILIEEGNFKVDYRVSNQIVKGVFENLEYTIRDIQEQYPKNIKIIK